MKRFAISFAASAAFMLAVAGTRHLAPLPAHAQTTAYAPEWCKALPRPEYKALERVPVSDPWFEVYRPAPGVFAIYEPHQSEETIAYLITGDHTAILFDTGMGISDIKKVTAELTKLPIIVLNSHTHDDHVGQLGVQHYLQPRYGFHARQRKGLKTGRA